VHDEERPFEGSLVLDVPSNEVAEVRGLLRHEMQHAVQLDAPLKADVGMDDNWHAVVRTYAYCLHQSKTVTTPRRRPTNFVKSGIRLQILPGLARAHMICTIFYQLSALLYGYR
jgi:hypothetical protein